MRCGLLFDQYPANSASALRLLTCGALFYSSPPSLAGHGWGTFGNAAAAATARDDAAAPFAAASPAASSASDVIVAGAGDEEKTWEG